LNQNESRELFNKIFKNELSNSEVREILISLYEKGESGEEIAGAMEAMKSHSVKVHVDDEFRDKIIDNCGTGGDKSGSFNVSTTVAFVMAGAGSYVAKHGNRSITSKSGSADVLELLGFNLNLSPMQHSMLLQNSRFTFMFAQQHHPAMRHIMPIRKSIPHRTIFNILGPLTNPADVKRQLIGVFHKDFVPPIVDALQILDMRSAIVVSGADGMDEVSISDKTYYRELKDGKISEGEVTPEEFGLQRASFDEIKGGDARENGDILLNILKGQELGAKRDIVLLNSAFGFVAEGRARDIQDGLEIARDSIDSGKAFQQFNMIIDMSKKI
jgi:anthranilate phosphoribosyltransferase